MLAMISSAESIEFTRELPSDITLGPVGSFVINSRGQLIDVSGELTSFSFSLTHATDVYSTGTIHPLGVIDFD